MARQRKGGARKGRKVPTDAVASLPELSRLIDLPAFDDLALSQAQREAYQAHLSTLEAEGIDPSEVEPACVVRLDRYFPALCAASGVFRAEFSFRFGVVREPSAAVGDWVVVRRPEGHNMGVIEFVLPRESDIARWRGGARGERQTLAANVDTVLVVQALGGRGMDMERVARSAVIAADCGAQAAVVLTKADRAGAEGLFNNMQIVRRVLGPKVPLAATCAGAPEAAESLAQVASQAGALWGTEGVRDLVPAGQVAIVLGESGAGKSTLLNALLGHEALETAGVRERDDRGRHTTVSRRMVKIPCAGVIVDEPGLRSLPVMGHERGLARVFPQVAAAARECRFRDCTHLHEPGCAVRALAESGTVPPEMVEAYVGLAREMRENSATLDPDVVL